MNSPHNNNSKEYIAPKEGGISFRYEDPKVHKRRAQKYSSWGRAKMMIEFVSVSGVLFFILLIIVNFPAYHAQMMFYYDEWTGANVEKQTQLEELTGLKASAPLEKREVMVEFSRDVPPLQMSITPPDNRIIIPRIGKNIPIQDVALDSLVNENWEALETDIQKALEEGVVRYPGTAKPGETGNVFITGHSSYYLWAPGAYKDVFATLPNVEEGDTITIFYDQQKYTYKIEEKRVVKPTDVDVLRQGDDKRLTLMTCVPVGTNLNRLILVGYQQES